MESSTINLPTNKETFFKWAVSTKLCTSINNYELSASTKTQDLYRYLIDQRGLNGRYAVTIIEKATRFIVDSGNELRELIKDLFSFPIDYDLTQDIGIINFWKTILSPQKSAIRSKLLFSRLLEERGFGLLIFPENQTIELSNIFFAKEEASDYDDEAKIEEDHNRRSPSGERGYHWVDESTDRTYPTKEAAKADGANMDSTNAKTYPKPHYLDE